MHKFSWFSFFFLFILNKTNWQFQSIWFYLISLLLPIWWWTKSSNSLVKSAMFFDRCSVHSVFNFWIKVSFLLTIGPKCFGLKPLLFLLWGSPLSSAWLHCVFWRLNCSVKTQIHSPHCRLYCFHWGRGRHPQHHTDVLHRLPRK